MKSIPTTQFTLKFISFDKFAPLIPVEGTGNELVVDDHVQVTVLEGYGLEQLVGTAEYGDSMYKMLACKLRKANEENMIELLRQDLFTYLKQEIMWKGNFYDIVEEMALNSANNFGEPEYAIRVAPRTWMLAKPDDFKIMQLEDKVCLTPTNSNKNVLYNVQRISEEEVKEASDVILKEARKKLKRKMGNENS